MYGLASIFRDGWSISSKASGINIEDFDSKYAQDAVNWKSQCLIHVSSGRLQRCSDYETLIQLSLLPMNCSNVAVFDTNEVSIPAIPDSEGYQQNLGDL